MSGLVERSWSVAPPRAAPSALSPDGLPRPRLSCSPPLDTLADIWSAPHSDISRGHTPDKSHRSELAVAAHSWRRRLSPGRRRHTGEASRDARWPPCQRAGPALIKDAEPNWSGQHLLPLDPGG
ncbi:hypothetical protein EYF80_060244 [Liparis tanakae]|uniref:Uncharacterized protein n=1 Tax=Liparis tanakae TaxID=230148 RepID=A0A4Z2EKX8_9TELE|nr:hypothetical protein EYF80_060244 [Liparis tanakae]